MTNENLQAIFYNRRNPDSTGDTLIKALKDEADYHRRVVNWAGKVSREAPDAAAIVSYMHLVISETLEALAGRLEE